MICWGEKQSAATERNTEKVNKNWVEVHCLILKIANPEQNPPAPKSLLYHVRVRARIVFCKEISTFAHTVYFCHLGRWNVP